MQAAVESGKMTREQVKEAWIKIKSKDKAERKGMDDKDRGDQRSSMSREEATERYRRMLEAKRGKR